MTISAEAEPPPTGIATSPAEAFVEIPVPDIAGPAFRKPGYLQPHQLPDAMALAACQVLEASTPFNESSTVGSRKSVPDLPKFSRTIL
ncbi:MAG: hypothetical protein OEN22_04965 [Gammaproteobacteria bacterium]|nr:hypothetical protein [Gammaproteobacteria bacterium]